MKKNIWGERRLEIDPEGGQGPAWTMEKRRGYTENGHNNCGEPQARTHAFRTVACWVHTTHRSCSSHGILHELLPDNHYFSFSVLGTCYDDGNNNNNNNNIY